MQSWATTAGNLSPGAASRRLRICVAMYGFGIVLAVTLIKLALPRWTRGLIFAPFFLGSMMLFQGLYRT